MPVQKRDRPVIDKNDLNKLKNKLKRNKTLKDERASRLYRQHLNMINSKDL
jgi:RNA polymerase-interacting CarD/CdnL/TRCF family regulator